jgi:hypothetical protein
MGLETVYTSVFADDEGFTDSLVCAFFLGAEVCCIPVVGFPVIASINSVISFFVLMFWTVILYMGL